jgi:hypothetical protein
MRDARLCRRMARVLVPQLGQALKRRRRRLRVALKL